MKTYLIKGFAAFVVMFAVAGPAQAEWREAKSENFTVIGDMPEGDLHRAAVLWSRAPDAAQIERNVAGAVEIFLHGTLGRNAAIRPPAAAR